MADGTILLDTGVNTNGLDKGVELIKKGVKGAADGADMLQKSINNAFAAAQQDSKVKFGNISNQMKSVTKQIEEETKSLAEMQNEVQRIQSKLSDASLSPMSVDPGEHQLLTEDLNRMSVAIEETKTIIDGLEKEYQTLAKERDKVSKEIEKAAQRQTKAEQREAAKQEKIVEKQQKTAIKQQTALSKSMDHFGVRLRGIVGSALVFNIISAGLRSMTQYFGNALKANDDFSKALSQLKGALLTAFQPIYNAVAPALTYLVQLATTAVQAIALLFATLSGSTLEESAKAAEKLYDQADGYKAAGAAAKKASKQVAAFDEIQKISNESTAGGGGGSSSGTSKPNFKFDALPSDLAHTIEKIAFNLNDIFFDWSNFEEGDIAKKVVAGLNVLGGAAIGFAIAGGTGLIVGTAAGIALTLLITSIVPETEWASIEQSFSGFFGTIEAWLTGDWDGMISSFNSAWEGFLKSDFWSGENSLGSRILSAVGIDYQAVRTKLLGYIGRGGSMWNLFEDAYGDFFGFFFGGKREETKKLPGGARDVLGVGDSLRTEGNGGPLSDALNAQKIELTGFIKWYTDTWNEFINDFLGGPQSRGTGEGRGRSGLIEAANEETGGLTKIWEDYFDWYEGTWIDYIGSVDKLNDDHFANLESATALIWGTIGDIINGEWDKVKETWGPVATWFDDNVIKPVSEFFATLWGAAPGQATEAWEGIKEVFNSVGKFFSDVFGNAWQAVIDVFSDGGDIFTNIQDGIAAAFKSIVNDLIDGINSVVSKPFTKINSALRTIKGIEILGIKPFSGISTISVPKIPYLAQGAVLPANKPFMAVVGDQRHGTNVEAPLTTIQEAVANVMDGQTSAILAGFEMSIGVQREILAAVLGIHIGDDAIVQAVSRYNSKMAVVRGY